MLRLTTDSENPYRVWLSALSDREPRDGCRGLPSNIPGAVHPRPCLSGLAPPGLLLSSSASLKYPLSLPESKGRSGSAREGR